MADVSPVIVTPIEEERIHRCPKTLCWCDELVFVGNESFDDPKKIAKEYMSKIYRTEEHHSYVNRSTNTD